MNSTSDPANILLMLPLAWQYPSLLYLTLSFASALYVFGYISDRLDRYGNKYSVLGDCSWWGRRTWFWTRSAQDMPSLTLEGYTKYSQEDKIWGVWIFDRLFHVLPPSMMEEVRRLSPNKASFMGLVDELFMLSAHTGNTLKERHHIAALKEYLIPNLPNMTDGLAREIDAQLSHQFDSSDMGAREWNFHNLWDTMLDVSFGLVGPLLIDSDLGRSEEFIHHSSEYCKAIPFWAALKFMMPSFLYKASSWFLAPAWAICRHLREVQKLVIPEIQRRRNRPPPVCDVLQGLLEHANGTNSQQTEQEIVNQMLFVLFAGADLLAVVLCQLVYTTMAYPEYEQELLEEIVQALDACAGWDEVTAASMAKLDSFLREVLRLNPPIGCMVQRKMFQDLTLSDGRVLKAGDNVLFPTHAVLCDPQLYPEPNKFNPSRFLESDKTKSAVQTATQTKQYAVFGYGQQSCPGRFYGILASKLVLAKLLMSYEMRFVPFRKGSPVGVARGVQLAPNMDTCVAFRRRR